MNQEEDEKGVTLFDIFNRIVTAIFSSDNGPLIQRIRGSVSENVPLIHQASKNTARNVYSWTRKGSPLRALLVVSVGTIALLALTGLLVFMVFFVAAAAPTPLISHGWIGFFWTIWLSNNEGSKSCQRSLSRQGQQYQLILPPDMFSTTMMPDEYSYSQEKKAYFYRIILNQLSLVFLSP
ncbi:hypothetical protein HAX54_023661 [Datura stramonium]|uniref:Uncharacterized protein n=1 Tax=Datura stramonium TaxID=4076 RepID=A0ABS8UWM5_DATST|nr:hypothetical protein [Datura stramonium]